MKNSRGFIGASQSQQLIHREGREHIEKISVSETELSSPYSGPARCSRLRRLLFGFMHRYLNGLDEVFAQCSDLLRLHQAFLQPQSIIHREWLVLFNRVFEIGTEATIFPFTEPGLLGVSGMVEVGHRVSLFAEHKRHRVPR